MERCEHIPRVQVETLAQIRELERVRPGVLQQLLALYASSGARQLETIAAGLPLPEHAALRVAFHALKGSAASLGALRCAALAERGEQAAARGADSGALAAIASALRAEFAASTSALAEAVAGLDGGASPGAADREA